MKSKIQNPPLKQRMMIKRTILVSAAVLFVGITAFATFTRSGNGNARVDIKPGKEECINKSLYFNTKDMNGQPKSCKKVKVKEGC